MTAYAVKAAREGKVETSWAAQNADYERALAAFVAAILDARANGQFVTVFADFARRAALLGALLALEQVTLKLTLPGVPDLYQGTEFWDFSLVDPDNRRPVDFAARRRALAAPRQASERLDESISWPELCAGWEDGRVKFALMRHLLALRRQYPDLFTHGHYAPLPAAGPNHMNLLAFSRSHRGVKLAVAVGRHFRSTTDSGRRWPQPPRWDATLQFPSRISFRDVFSGRTFPGSRPIPASELFAMLPVAVLIGS
jgi:(1->4)-alpha-D-glucan 1-alpha-D-glucosylmutase